MASSGVSRTAAVAPAAGGFEVRLDGKPLRTPRGSALIVPSAALAEAIAAEWHGTGAKPDPARLPLTRSAATALDIVTPRRVEVAGDLLAYAETELLCHRATSPSELVARQVACWQPLLDWLAVQHGVRLQSTAALHAVAQDPAALARLALVLDRLDAFRMAGLSLAVATAGSLVIGLALAEGRLDAGAAFEAAELDASFQIERWGEDTIAAQRRAGLRADLAAAERLFHLLGATGTA